MNTGESPSRPVTPRPSWDQYFARICGEVAKRSTCLRRHVGALIVRDKRILCTGYNGAPSGLEHCLDTGCPREQKRVPSGTGWELCRGLHAEMNAILQAAAHGVSVKGSVIYSTAFPCSLCAKMIINAGIERVVALGEYPDAMAKEMLGEAGVRLEMFDPATDKTTLLAQQGNPGTDQGKTGE